MDIKRKNILSLQIDNESDIGVCRRKAVSLATQIGFDKVKIGEVAIMVTELVSNVLKHGGGRGKIVICHFSEEDGSKAIEIWCCDAGNGFTNINNAMKDGFTAQKSLGIGMGSIRRFSDKFEINPQSSSEFKNEFLAGHLDLKHCIRTLKYLPQKQWIGSNKNIEIGAISICKPNEKLNGDSYVVNHINPNNTIVAVIDGLGHGAEANIASQIAKEQIIQKSDLPLNELLKQIHSALKGTRGCVIAIAQINTEKNKLTFTGIGNIESYIISKNSRKSLISFGGIMGHNMRTPRIYENDFNIGDNLILFSDGITSRWKFDEFDWLEHPQKIAEQLITKHTRANDDATVLIIRHIN